MKVLLTTHGYPPELIGGTEVTVQTLAENLLRLGHQVVVVSGSMAWEGGFRVTVVDQQPRSPALAGRRVRVYRLHRDDLFFDTWAKAREPRVAAAFAEVLERERPDVVHVHHWLRLSSDLVAVAARAGRPAVVTLHDLWTSCLLTFRVIPSTDVFCTVPQAADPCLECARALPPHPTFADRAREERWFDDHRSVLSRELSLARVLIAPSAAHGRSVLELAGRAELAERVQVLPPGTELELRRRAPPPPPGPGEPLRLASFGHLSRLKGPDLLLRALRLLPDPRAVRLELAGGEVDPAYAAQVRALAVGLDVRFHGPYDLAELDRHPASDVHLMVSGSRALESHGLVLDEALLLGLPCLVPNSGALGERAAGRPYALTYRSGDAADLARVLGALCADPARLVAMREAVPAPQDCTLAALEHARRTVAFYETALALGVPPVAARDPREEARADRRRRDHDAACRRGGAIPSR